MGRACRSAAPLAGPFGFVRWGGGGGATKGVHRGKSWQIGGGFHSAKHMHKAVQCKCGECPASKTVQNPHGTGGDDNRS